MLKLNKVYNLDCFEGFNQLKDKSVDFVFTSPPFKSTDVQGYRKSRIRKGDIKGDYWTWYDRFMTEVLRVTKDYAIIFNSSTNMNHILKRYPEPYRVLIWTKSPTRMAFRYEPIFIYKCSPNYLLNKFLWKDVFQVPPVCNGQHPYQNPFKLYLEIIKMLPREKTILDPCIGSGITAAACKSLGHNFIGFEKEKEYFDIALQNVAQENLKRFTGNL